MKKGFTLVELIGVIIILGLIILIALPPILNAIREKESEISEASEEIIYNATSLYVGDNSNSFPRVNGNTFCVTLDTLTQGDYLPDVVYDAVSGDEVPLTNTVEVKYEQDRFSYNLNNECVEKVEVIPNAPELLDNMIPIRYDGTNWIYADTNEKWYDYLNKEWANAVVLNSGVSKNVGDTIIESDIALWYVWIPRYKYQLFNVNNGSVDEQLINIRFESGKSTTGTVSCIDAINQTDSAGNLISETCTNATNGNWYTHPAFTFGDKELTGFWVGKFEVSGTTDNITIKPGMQSLRNTTVSSFFNAIQGINSDYEINGGNSHIIKNMEWGAVAYLKQSAYGLGITDIGINNDSGYYTGGGNTVTSYKTNTIQSTTGTVYGIYDMSGGAWEYVMGNMVDSNGTFYISNSGFISAPSVVYYDRYTYDNNYTSYFRGKLGDATKETLLNLASTSGGWYGDFSAFVNSDYSWFIRGGNYSGNAGSGLFDYAYAFGGNGDNGTRAVLTP